MKNSITIITIIIILVTSSCIEENFPTEKASADQIAVSAAALEALANSTAAFMNAYNVLAYSSSEAYDFGYPGLMIIRDVCLQDFPISKTGYDYFNNPWASNNYLGNYNYQYFIWFYHYQLINNAHSIIGIVDPEDATETALHFLGGALVYRALGYMDLMRMIEYKHTGVSELDNQANADNIWGLTIPIVTPATTEEEGRENPRAPFYKMYRFIMDDLNKAEKYLENYTRPAKNFADVTVVYGLKARLWLEMGSRFSLYPNDLSAQISHETDEELRQWDTLGITSAKDCYDKAILYARKAIDSGKYAPLTKDQWHDTVNGFNNSNSQTSWMWAIIIGTDAVKHNYKNFIGNVSPETTFGVTNYKYDTYRMIARSLYDQIPDSDWRKVTWIDPEDAGQTPGDKYYTLLDNETWALAPAYTGFKFRPGSGDGDAYKIGAATDLPVMRIEEMYFIEAEALAYSRDITSGVSALEDFINTYRYSDSSYECGSLAGIEEFQDKLLVQKRIEFWGEGILYFDYKRLEKTVVRGYNGTNHIAAQRYNSLPGYVAPWLNVYIAEFETTRNNAIIRNPDPTKAIPLWSE